MIDPEIRDLKVEWVKLPGAMPGMRHLHIATTHGDNSVREFWLTEKQGQAVGQFACAEREAKLIADTRLAIADNPPKLKVKDASDAMFIAGWTHGVEDYQQHIRATTPAQIAAQAEERDRRVVAEAQESLYLELQSAIRNHIKDAPEEKRAASALLQDVFQVCKRPALRAAVQPGG